MFNLSRKAKLVRMRADQLAVHPIAQRKLRAQHLKDITAKLDLDAIGTLHAVDYEIADLDENGKPYGRKLWVVDGQHRLLALMANGLGEWEVDVLVHLDVRDNQRASDLFLKLNKKATVSPFAKFQNGLVAGSEEETNINGIVASFGLKISESSGNKRIAAVTALRTAYRLDGGRSLGLSLRVIGDAWGFSSEALDGKLIEGIAIAIAQGNGKTDLYSLAKKLSKAGPPSALIGRAKNYGAGHSSLSYRMARLVLEIYNNGKRKKGIAA